VVVEQEIHADPGEVHLSFHEIPTSGYQWVLCDCPPMVTLLDSSFELSPPPVTVGGGGTKVFRLRVETPGIYNLTFKLARAWEPKPIDIRRISLVIEPA
jgi:predicted secreted protein